MPSPSRRVKGAWISWPLTGLLVVGAVIGLASAGTEGSGNGASRPGTNGSRTSSTCNSTKFFNTAGIMLDANEGAGHFQKVIWNAPSNGGVSAGILLWNQNNGSLLALLQSWHSTDPTLFQSVFGTNSPKLLTASTLGALTFSAHNALGRQLTKALAEPKFQSVQKQLLDTLLQNTVTIAAQQGYHSQRFIVVLADVSTEQGTLAADHALRSVPRGLSEAQAASRLERDTEKRAYGTERDQRINAWFSATKGICA